MKELLKKINFNKVLKYLLFMFLTLMLQNMVLSHIRPLDVCPMVLPAAAAAVGMFEGALWGPVFSLVMGFFADMSFVENTIFFTVLLPLLSLLSAFVSQFFINRRFFAFMGIAFLELLITAALQMLKTLAADAWDTDMLTVALLQAVWSLPPAALMYLPPAKWIK